MKKNAKKLSHYFSSKEITANTLEEIARWLVLMGACLFFVSWGHALREIAWWGAPTLILASRSLKGLFPLPKLDKIQTLLLIFILFAIASSANQDFFYDAYKTWKHHYLKTFLFSFSIFYLFRKHKKIDLLMHGLAAGSILLIIEITYLNVLDYLPNKQLDILYGSNAYHKYYRIMPFGLYFILYAAYKRRSKVFSIFNISILILALTNAILMRGRGMLLTIIITLCLYYLIANKLNKKHIFVLAGLVLLSLGGLYLKNPSHRIFDMGGASTTIRHQIKADYFSMWSVSTFSEMSLGKGISVKNKSKTYETFIKTGASQFHEPYASHNTYIGSLFDYGLIGCLLLLILFFFLIKISIQNLFQYRDFTKDQNRIIYLTSLSLIICIIANYFFVGFSEDLYIYTLGLITGMGSILQLEGNQNEKKSA